jgi:hypothetical protein
MVKSNQPDGFPVPVDPESPAEAEESGRRTDPEILSLSRILRILDDLADDSARSRVIAYLSSRFSKE